MKSALIALVIGFAFPAMAAPLDYKPDPYEQHLYHPERFKRHHRARLPRARPHHNYMMHPVAYRRAARFHRSRHWYRHHEVGSMYAATYYGPLPMARYTLVNGRWIKRYGPGLFYPVAPWYW